ncbi:MAG: DUF2007 domain-containing protein [Lentisphaeria bacterium]|nr:DUF2007 domain-containing protein [Lentisphaeria bacterium]NQZ69992.1 DUF2007 domain-containing protein [Lentisphaeria bacterium]
MRKDHLVVIGNFTQASDAHIARIRLDAEDIESFVEGENTAIVYPLYGTAIGGIRLVVHEDDREAAQKIIEEMAVDTRASYLESLSICPACKSENIAKDPIPGIIMILLFALTFGLYWLVFYRKYRCEDCSHVW